MSKLQEMLLSTSVMSFIAAPHFTLQLKHFNISINFHFVKKFTAAREIQKQKLKTVIFQL